MNAVPNNSPLHRDVNHNYNDEFGDAVKVSEEWDPLPIPVKKKLFFG